jgi:hypothetical protein
VPEYIIRTVVPHENAPAIVRERIIRAKNEAQAIRFAVADTLQVARASIDDAIRLGKDGVSVEIATE